MLDESIRDQVIKMITEEKDQYLSYKTLCARYKITPDPIATAIVMAKTETLETIVKILPK
jgi:fructose-1,6-bisphosphatase